MLGAFSFRISFRPKNSLPVLPNIQSNQSKDVNELLTEYSVKGLKEKFNEYVLPSLENKNINKIKENYNDRLMHRQLLKLA